MGPPPVGQRVFIQHIQTGSPYQMGSRGRRPVEVTGSSEGLLFNCIDIKIQVSIKLKINLKVILSL
jgi:hypothetical protein